MKKYFILAAAVVAMASCQKNSTIEMLPVEDSPIDFSAYTKTAVTKGTIVTGAEVDSIGVFAFYQPNSNGAAVNFNTHKFASPDYMYNQLVKADYDATAKKFGAWTYSPVKYWPNNKGDQLSFFAYAPYDAGKTWEDMGISTDANGSKMEVSFPIYDSVKDQIDYLWANPQVNKGNASAVENGIPVYNASAKDSTINFAFSHITSQLSLYIGVENDSTGKAPGKWTDPNTTITVEKVVFKGLGDKIALKYTMPIYAGTDPVVTVSGSQDIILSKEGGNFQNEIIDKAKYDTASMYRPLLAEEDNAKGVKEPGFMFLAPQNLANAEIEFEYKVETKDAANPANSSVIVNTISRKWNEIVDAALTEIKAGKAYKLNILIGMNDVNFDASETPWEDATTHRIDVPANK